MKKVLITVLLATGIAVSSFSQIKIGVNLGANIPANGFTGYSVGFGGYVNGRYVFADDKVAVGADLGYFTVGTPISEIKVSMLPILGAFEYFFTNSGFKPFVGLKAGFVTTTIKSDLPFFGSISVSSSSFAVGPQVGFAYGINDNLDLNLTAQYLYIASTGSATGILPITAGISYKFGK